MMLAKGVEASGWLDRVGRATIARVASERALALVLIAGSALAAMLLTNDIVLFAVVPLTLGLGRIARLPLCRLVIFEALAVNAGAMLTRISHQGMGKGCPVRYNLGVINKLYTDNGAAL
jgi:Na+/H+ antiporter NhaD/arsenite permease-like protein